MNARYRFVEIGWFVACVMMLGCERSKTPGAESSAKTGESATPTVYVVNYPLQYFAERIGSDAVDVVFPAPADEDPADWKPDADMIAAYQQADLILLNGASYAKWVAHATLPASTLIDTSRFFKDQYIALVDAAQHAHGPEGEHAHSGFAATTWLDPTQAVQQAEAIREILTRFLPDRGQSLTDNFRSLERDLTSLDARLKELTRGHGETPLLASHPVYQYFTRRYGLNLKSLHWEPDTVPSEPQWAEFDEIRQDHPAKWMIWEAVPEKETVDKLGERGVQCVVFDPCGKVPSEGDYLQVMQRNVDALEPVFQPR